MAISDPQGLLASPLTIIDCRDEAEGVKAIADIISQHHVEKVIVGLPHSMDGSLGRQGERVKTFAHKLCGYTDVPVEFRDERLTTVSAKRLMTAARTKKSRQKARDDAVAAALILQGYLDEAHQRQAGIDI